jgi:hypothetical protein
MRTCEDGDMNPTNPTKKYIAGLLKSENIIPRPESVDQCLYGWLQAAGTPRAEREARTRAINEGVFWGGDCEGIGYCTYTYLAMATKKGEQLRMKI